MEERRAWDSHCLTGAIGNHPFVRGFGNEFWGFPNEGNHVFVGLWGVIPTHSLPIAPASCLTGFGRQKHPASKLPSREYPYMRKKEKSL